MAERPLIPWTPFIPHKPHPKQLAFLLLNNYLEVGFGGSAGPGKSSALLMASLQYVDVPKYSAIIFRKTLTDLLKSSALLSRAMEWLGPWSPYVKYVPSEHAFVFPSSARLEFGYIGQFRSEERYQGAEYQFVGFDECTQHFEEDYLYLFSRLRKPQCEHHAGRVIDGEDAPLPDDPDCKLCQQYAPLRQVPLRMRSATNPGSVGHKWYKDRFKITFDPQLKAWVGKDPERPFVPARVSDNPSVSQEEYTKSLMNLDPVTRAMLLDGDWAASQDARFKYQWACFYEKHGERITIYRRDGSRTMFNVWDIQRFCVCDFAASTAEGIAGIRFHERRQPAWTVITTWGVSPNKDLLLLDMQRFQSESPVILSSAKFAVKKWRPSFVLAEVNGVGLPVAQMMESMGLPIKPLFQFRGKVENAVEAQVRMEQGKVYLPKEAEWRKVFDDEVFVWTGHPHETDDIVDTLSNACHQVTMIAGEDQFDPTFGGSGASAILPTSTTYVSPIGGGSYVRPY